MGAQPPATQQSLPPAQQSRGGMLSGIGSTIAQGMAFGTGSAIAHRAVGAVSDAVTGGVAEQQSSPTSRQMEGQQMESQQNDACAYDKTMYFDCLKTNNGDQQSCQFLYEQMQNCQRSETTFG